jgi:hypothetical protein
VLEDLEYYEGMWSPRGVLSSNHHPAHLKVTLRRVCYSIIATERNETYEPRRRAPATRTVFFKDDSEADSQDDSDSSSDSDDDDDHDHDAGIQRTYSRQYQLRRQGIKLSRMWFPQFTVLEEIELEQLTLYGPVFGERFSRSDDRSSRLSKPEDFIDRFQRSLRRL